MKPIKAEFHFHTKESSHCSDVSVEESIPVYKEHGYELIVVTDHFSMEYTLPGRPWEEQVERYLEGYKKAKEVGDRIGVKIMFGTEFRFSTGNCDDFLAYGHDVDFLYDHPFIYEKTVDEAYKYFRECGVYFSQAHPFREEIRLCNPDYLDGIEVFNGHADHDSHNDVALKYSIEHDLIGTCGTDFHHRNGYCKTAMMLEYMPEKQSDLAKILFERKFTRVTDQQ
ncbi:MAG: PHP domain-containing protein [Clostridia bacterium]|nr:PHP domain-containing protein [Clostridia bacterium]